MYFLTEYLGIRMSVIYPRGKVQNTRDASTGMGIKLILIREGKVWKFSILTMKWYISKSIFSSACFYICVLLSEIYKYRNENDHNLTSIRNFNMYFYFFLCQISKHTGWKHLQCFWKFQSLTCTFVYVFPCISILLSSEDNDKYYDTLEVHQNFRLTLLRY